MGNYQSTAEIKRSPELKKYCYEAVDALIKMDQLYKDEVESVERVVPKGQNVNVGSNNMKTFNITGKTSTVTLSQSTVLETTVKTAIYVDAFTTMKLDPYVKVIICDLVGMTKEDAGEREMPSYSDPRYLLRMVGVENVTEASFVDDDIVYKDANGINTKQPIQQIREYIHQYYIDTLDDKMAEAKNAIKNVTNNISVSTNNASSNELNIKFRKMKNSTVNIAQANESKQTVELEFTQIAEALSKIAENKEAENNSNADVNQIRDATDTNSNKSKSSAKATEGISKQSGMGEPKPKDPDSDMISDVMGEVAEDAKNKAAKKMGIKTKDPDQVRSASSSSSSGYDDQSSNNTMMIGIIVGVVVIVLGIIGFAVYMSMRNTNAMVAQMPPQYGPMTGGYGIPINYMPIRLH